MEAKALTELADRPFVIFVNQAELDASAPGLRVTACLCIDRAEELSREVRTPVPLSIHKDVHPQRLKQVNDVIMNSQSNQSWWHLQLRS